MLREGKQTESQLLSGMDPVRERANKHPTLCGQTDRDQCYCGKESSVEEKLAGWGRRELSGAPAKKRLEAEGTQGWEVLRGPTVDSRGERGAAREGHRKPPEFGEIL